MLYDKYKIYKVTDFLVGENANKTVINYIPENFNHVIIFEDNLRMKLINFIKLINESNQEFNFKMGGSLKPNKAIYLNEMIDGDIKKGNNVLVQVCFGEITMRVLEDLKAQYEKNLDTINLSFVIGENIQTVMYDGDSFSLIKQLYVKSDDVLINLNNKQKKKEYL